MLGDNTAGPLWKVFVNSTPSEGLQASEVPLELRSVQTITSGLSESTMLIASKLVGPVCSFNLVSFLLATLSALAAYWMFFWALRLHVVVATGFATFLAVGPYMYMVGNSHQQWLGIWPLFVQIGSAILLLRTRRVLWGIVGALAVLATFISDPYMPLAALGVIGSTLVVLAFSGLGGGESVSSYLKSLWKPLVAFVAVTFVGGALLVASLFWLGRQSSLRIPDRSLDALWGIEPLAPLSGGISVWLERLQFGKFDTLSWPSDQVEVFFFVGLTGLVGLALALFWLIRSRVSQLSNNDCTLLLFGMGLIFFGVLLSSPKHLFILGAEITTPNGLLFEQIPLFRFAWRYAILTLVGVLIIAAFGWSHLFRACRALWKRLLQGLFALMLFIDVVLYAPFQTDGFDFSFTPDAYTWVREAQLNPGESVIHLTPPRDAGQIFKTWQIVYNKPLVNADGPMGSPERKVFDELYGFVQPHTPCIANAWNIRYIIRPNSELPIPAFSGQRLAETFRLTNQAQSWPQSIFETYATERAWYDVDIYENDGVATAHLYLSHGSGFDTGSWDGVRGSAAMNGKEAFLKVNQTGPGSASRSETETALNFDFRGGVTPQRVRVTRLNGEVIWEGLLGQDWQRVGFRSKDQEMIRIEAGSDKGTGPVRVGRFGAGDCP